MSNSDDFDLVDDALPDTLGHAGASTRALGISAATFANAMTQAFAKAATGGKQFDDVLKQVALRLSNMAMTNAFRLLFSNAASSIATPGYFPAPTGTFSFSGEAGETLAAAGGGEAMFGSAVSMNAPANISVQIATPDPAGFRQSEAYITGQIARAVARGQRGM